MADLIRIKGGTGDVPKLQDRELAIKKNGNTSALYCGIDGENVRLCSAADAANVDRFVGMVLDMRMELKNITTRLEKLENPSE